MADLDAVLARIDQDEAAALDRLFALLRIESISTDPAYKDQCQAAADWLVEDLRSIGFDAKREDTPGHPDGHRDGRRGRDDAPLLRTL